MVAAPEAEAHAQLRLTRARMIRAARRITAALAPPPGALPAGAQGLTPM
jgi:hypothetical protein